MSNKSLSFRQCITFREHRRLKGWQPHFQPNVSKSSISTIVHSFAAVTQHNWEHNQCIVTNLGDHNSATTLLPCMRQVFFLQLQRRDGHDATIMQTWWNVLRLSKTCFWLGVDAWNPKRNSGNGFLRQTCQTNLSPFGSASHLENIGGWKAGSPTSNPLLLKAQSRQSFIGLQQPRVTTESTINIL